MCTKGMLIEMGVDFRDLMTDHSTPASSSPPPFLSCPQEVTVSIGLWRTSYVIWIKSTEILIQLVYMMLWNEDL